MKRFLFSTLFLLTVVSMGAQSLSYVKDLIEQGRYIDAAKRLRPLADGGNADAQVMAAQLFFEGKGVTKNNAQGVKYATLAANQGNEEAIMLLVNYYWNSNPSKAYEVLKNYTEKHPYLKKKEIGLYLSRCYLTGHGTNKNEELGWRIMEGNENFHQLKDDQDVYRDYWKFKVKQAGKECIEDYADYLYDYNQMDMFKKVCDFIASEHRQVIFYYEKRAEEGNAFAYAMLANKYYEMGNITMAKKAVQKALDGGSVYGEKLKDKIYFVPVTYSDLTWNYGNKRLTLLKIVHKYDKTIFYYHWKGYADDSWIRFDDGSYVDNEGLRYEMISPGKEQYGTNRFFTVEFEPIPVNWKVLNIGLGERFYFRNIRRE